LVLSVLGVSEEDIVNEYYLSNRYTEGVLSKTMMGSMKREVARILAGVKPAYIKATFATIKTQYGSVETMLEKELGIGAAKRQKLKAIYTF
jgi:protein-tyrosine phosphatase